MYSPAEVARRYVETGKSKAALPAGRMLPVSYTHLTLPTILLV